MELLTPKAAFAAKLETIRRQLTSAEWIADAFEVLDPWLATLPIAKEIGLKLEHSPQYPGVQVLQLKLDRDGPSQRRWIGSYSPEHGKVEFLSNQNGNDNIVLKTEVEFQEHVTERLLSACKSS